MTTETINNQPRADGKAEHTTAQPICRSRMGTRVRLLAYCAVQEERDTLIWGLRIDDNALRCYYASEILLPDGIEHVSGAMLSLERTDKARAMQLSKECPQ